MSIAPARSRRIAAALALLAMVGCNGAATETAAAGTAEMPAAPKPGRGEAAQRADFVLSGEMTQGGWARGTVPAGTVSLSFDGQPISFESDGRFMIAFDRDAGPAAALVARLRDGRTVTDTIAVRPRNWKIEHVDIARRHGGPTEEFMKLRRPELARINAARAMDTGSEGWREHFIWPVTGRISGLFGSQRIYRGEPGSYHSGIDITTGTSGSPIVAPADGVVILAADHPFTLEGNLLMIDHGMGLNSAFLHCSQILVKEGEHVHQGQLIARIGMTGRATGPHLHWSLKWRDARLDPLLFTGPMH